LYNEIIPATPLGNQTVKHEVYTVVCSITNWFIYMKQTTRPAVRDTKLDSSISDANYFMTFHRQITQP